MTLTSAQLDRAEAQNQNWGTVLNWRTCFNDIVSLLVDEGLLSGTRSPNSRTFAEAIGAWQRRHQGIRAEDGILGPQTWRDLRRAIRFGDGPTSESRLWTYPWGQDAILEVRFKRGAVWQFSRYDPGFTARNVRRMIRYFMESITNECTNSRTLGNLIIAALNDLWSGSPPDNSKLFWQAINELNLAIRAANHCDLEGVINAIKRGLNYVNNARLRWQRYVNEHVAASERNTAILEFSHDLSISVLVCVTLPAAGITGAAAVVTEIVGTPALTAIFAEVREQALVRNGTDTAVNYSNIGRAASMSLISGLVGAAFAPLRELVAEVMKIAFPQVLGRLTQWTDARLADAILDWLAAQPINVVEEIVNGAIASIDQFRTSGSVPTSREFAEALARQLILKGFSGAVTTAGGAVARSQRFTQLRSQIPNYPTVSPTEIAIRPGQYLIRTESRAANRPGSYFIEEVFEDLGAAQQAAQQLSASEEVIRQRYGLAEVMIDENGRVERGNRVEVIRIYEVVEEMPAQRSTVRAQREGGAQIVRPAHLHAVRMGDPLLAADYQGGGTEIITPVGTELTLVRRVGGAYEVCNRRP